MRNYIDIYLLKTVNCIFSIKKLLFVVIDTRTAMHNNASFEFALRSFIIKNSNQKIKIKLIKSEISLKEKMLHL